MLVLGCRIGERVQIGDQIEVHIRDRAKRTAVTLAIEAPKEIPITRSGLAGANGGGSGSRAEASASTDPAAAKHANGKGARRRRVTIEPPARPQRAPGESPGARMLAQAFKRADIEVLNAVASGDALNQPIRRALMELSREELRQRKARRERAVIRG